MALIWSSDGKDIPSPFGGVSISQGDKEDNKFGQTTPPSYQD